VTQLPTPLSPPRQVTSPGRGQCLEPRTDVPLLYQLTVTGTAKDGARFVQDFPTAEVSKTQATRLRPEALLAPQYPPSFEKESPISLDPHPPHPPLCSLPCKLLPFCFLPQVCVSVGSAGAPHCVAAFDGPSYKDRSTDQEQSPGQSPDQSHGNAIYLSGLESGCHTLVISLVTLLGNL
jgi:hypothetical protein